MRVTTPASIERMKVRGLLKKYEPVCKRILLSMLDGSLKLEEQPLADDGLYEIHEYYGEYGDLYIAAQRLKKHNGINPRFNLKIISDDKTVDIGGQFAAKAYSMMHRAANRVESTITDEDVEDLMSKLPQ